MPLYPAAMKKAGVEGKVIIELGVDETGKIIYGKIIKALHPTLDMIVIQWIKRQKFTPATGPDGKAFKAKIYLPVLFSLTD
jgi:protein TonB